MARVRGRLQESRDRDRNALADRGTHPCGRSATHETERGVSHMANVNTVVVSGNLTRDPEVRWLSEDEKSAIVNVGIAVNRRRFDKKAEDYVEEVSFFDIEVYGGFAILAAKKLKKGDSTTVQGRLEQQTWGEGDDKKSKVVIVAEQIDSEGFFRSKDEDAAVAVTNGSSTTAATTTTEAPAAAPAADDDIPF